MKKIFIFLAAVLFMASVFAQAPQKMSYQAVIRNSSNALVANKQVSVQISILEGSSVGNAVYVETQTPTTNANGLVSFQIGEGTVVEGSFAAINWASGLFFIKTETDPAGGTDYTVVSVSQLLSVPYALYAETSGTPGVKGEQGEKGEKGDKGDKGDLGEKGEAGVAGEQGAKGNDGIDGKSAYQLWKDAGNTGTEADFLLSLIGKDGVDGKSAYKIWIAAGNFGSESDFLSSLQGSNGKAGKSAYQLWLDEGNKGTLSEFLAIKGEKGDAGKDGLSLYETWKAAGNEGTEAEFLATLKGEKGDMGETGETGAAGKDGENGLGGKSAYELWLDEGHTGTISEFLATKGEKGDTGEAGKDGINGQDGKDGLTTTVNGVEQVNGEITLTKANIGLANVDNTADLAKPISTATQKALDTKADKATTLAGYGIADAATIVYVDALKGKIEMLQNTLVAGGGVTDIDGNFYNTVTIGTQVWMAENLKTTKYADGTAIPLVNTTSTWNALTATSKAYCWYNDDVANKSTYGALYTWASAMNGAASMTANPSGIQGVCPTGWHLPSEAEWTQMENYLANNGHNYDGTTGGGSAKTAKSLASTSGWVSSSITGAAGNTDYPAYRNKSGFAALPGGYRDPNGTFKDMGLIGYWWFATENDASTARYPTIRYHYNYVTRSSWYKKLGFSVRCLRD